MLEFFPNVPDRMQSALDGLPGELRGGELPYYAASELVILEYLGRLAPTSEVFLESGIDDGGNLNPGWTTKVSLIGQWLFELRSTSGFDEICRRMNERSIRECYYELFSAHQFYKSGFDIYVRREIGVRGEDFDFCALRDNVTVNVEVTGFTTNTYSEQTVNNALNIKRKQLPNSAPAIIICVVPESWWVGSSRPLAKKLGKVANAFLAGTGRINCVAFFLESQNTWDNKKGGIGVGRVFESYPFFNPKPRIPMDAGSLFVGEHPASNKLRQAMERGEELTEIIAELRDSEFFRWVDDTMLRTAAGHE